MLAVVLERAPIADPRAESKRFVEDVARYRFAGRYVAGRRVLDIACGTGYGSTILATEGQARRIVGIDLARDALANACGSPLRHKVSFAIGRAERLPLRPETFDVVVSMETIEHLSEPEPFLLELRRVLRAGGLAVVSTPLNNTESRFRPDNPFHKREYSSIEFVNLIKGVFSAAEFWSQRTSYEDDLATATVVDRSLVTLIRGAARALLPPPIRKRIRRLLGSDGLRPVRSEIVPCVHADAGVQIAVCTKQVDR
jgi:ubiquinone/menaquinone biosynthesis C-methylase UbiE